MASEESSSMVFARGFVEECYNRTDNMYTLRTEKYEPLLSIVRSLRPRETQSVVRRSLVPAGFLLAL